MQNIRHNRNPAKIRQKRKTIKNKPVAGLSGALAPVESASAGYSPVVVHMPVKEKRKTTNSMKNA
jgi:hypothetical protein